MAGVELHRHEELGIELRTYVGESGFVVSAEDLAKSLNYGRTEHMLRFLREGQVVEVSRKDLGLPPGRAIRYVTESGMYRAVLRSNMPKAVEFQEWVEDEILPTIRKASAAGFDVIQEAKARVAELEKSNERMAKAMEEADRKSQEYAEGVYQSMLRYQKETDRENRFQKEEWEKRVDFWGNAYMAMREEAGRICEEYGISEDRLPIV